MWKKLMTRIKNFALKMKSEIITLYYVVRCRELFWIYKLLPCLVVVYALSPVDLIPDFIPLIGYLDNFILLPLGIALSVWLIPPYILEKCRAISNSNVDLTLF